MDERASSTELENTEMTETSARTADAAAPEPAPWRRRSFQFHGTAGEFYPLFARTVLLSIVTLGIYTLGV